MEASGSQPEQDPMNSSDVHPGYLGPVPPGQEAVVYEPQDQSPPPYQGEVRAIPREGETGSMLGHAATRGASVGFTAETTGAGSSGEAHGSAHRASRGANKGNALQEIKGVDEASKFLLLKAAKIQATAQRLKNNTRENGGSRFTYKSALSRDALNFVNLLTTPKVQKHVDELPLSEAGFDLISYGLGADELGAPKPQVLEGLNRFVAAQELKAETSSRKGRPTVTYRSKAGVEIGPFDNEEDDVVAEALKKLDPEFWYLDEETRAFYDGVMQLEKLVSPPKGYQPSSFRYGWAKPLRGMAERRKERKHNEGQKPVGMSDVELTRHILARWQKRAPDNVVIGSSIQGADSILAAVKEDIGLRLHRDSELRALGHKLAASGSSGQTTIPNYNLNVRPVDSDPLRPSAGDLGSGRQVLPRPSSPRHHLDPHQIEAQKRLRLNAGDEESE